MQQQIDALARYTRQRRHRVLATAALLDENGIDQVVAGKAVLAHEAAREIIATHAAMTAFREFSGEMHVVDIVVAVPCGRQTAAAS